MKIEDSEKRRQIDDRRLNIEDEERLDKVGLSKLALKARRGCLRQATITLSSITRCKERRVSYENYLSPTRTHDEDNITKVSHYLL